MKLISQSIEIHVPASNPLDVTATSVNMLTSLKTSVTMLLKSIGWKKRKKKIPFENDMWAIE